MIRTGSTIYGKGYFPVKATPVTANSNVSSAIASAARAALQEIGIRSDVSRSGVATKIPPASPSHQVHQVSKTFDEFVNPIRCRLATAIDALISELPNAANVNHTTFITLQKRSSGLPIRRSRVVPTKAAMLAAAAMRAAAVTEVNVGARYAWIYTQLFRTKDPSQTPGHSRRPYASSAPNAMPDAGQIAVAYPGAIAEKSPTYPAAA
jgi:hypothetical protein